MSKLEVCGYLPIRDERSKERDAEMRFYGRRTRGDILFECCMNVISRFLSDCFGLYADVHAVEVSCEYWAIPVRSFDRS